MQQQQQQQQQLVVVDNKSLATSDNSCVVAHEQHGAADQQPPLENPENQQPVTEEARQQMIADVKRQTTDLCSMLENYRKMENELKDDVLEFVLRDVNEQNMHMGIAKRVASAQQQLLSDTRYVGWAMKNSKGEFANSNSLVAARNSESRGGDAANQQQQQQRDNKNLDPMTTWHHVAEAVVQQLQLPVAMPLSSRVIPPRVALTLCHGHSAIESTDRVVAEKQLQRFATFVRLVEEWRDAVAAATGIPKAQLVPCVNGVPLVSPDAVLSVPGSSAAVDFTAPPFEEKFGALLASWYTACAAAPATALFSIASDRNRKWFGAVLKQGSNSSEVMSTAATSHADTLSLVPLASLVSSDAGVCSPLLCYGIVNEGTVLAAEPLVPVAALHLLSGFANIADLKEAICSSLARPTLRPLFDAGAIAKRAVVLFAISAASPPLLLDACELTPHLPTALLNWNDVCSMVRGLSSNNESSRNSGGGDGLTEGSSSNSMLFRGQKARVANLQAVEDEINDMKQQQQQAGVAQHLLSQIEFVMTGKHRREQEQNNASAGSYVRVGVVGAAAVALGAFLVSKLWAKQTNMKN